MSKLDSNRLSGNMRKLREAASPGDSFRLAASGMATVCLSIAAFIALLWIIIAIVRIIAGLGN